MLGADIRIEEDENRIWSVSSVGWCISYSIDIILGDIKLTSMGASSIGESSSRVRSTTSTNTAGWIGVSVSMVADNHAKDENTKAWMRMM